MSYPACTLPAMTKHPPVVDEALEHGRTVEPPSARACSRTDRSHGTLLHMSKRAHRATAERCLSYDASYESALGTVEQPTGDVAAEVDRLLLDDDSAQSRRLWPQAADD